MRQPVREQWKNPRRTGNARRDSQSRTTNACSWRKSDQKIIRLLQRSDEPKHLHGGLDPRRGDFFARELLHGPAT